jgi:hypothetical protein
MLNQVVMRLIQPLKVLNQRLRVPMPLPEHLESACEGSDSTREDIESRTEEIDSGGPLINRN